MWSLGWARATWSLNFALLGSITLRYETAKQRFLHRVLDGEGGAEPRVVITDKLASYPPAIRRALPNSEHRRHKG